MTKTPSRVYVSRYTAYQRARWSLGPRAVVDGSLGPSEQTWTHKLKLHQTRSELRSYGGWMTTDGQKQVKFDLPVRLDCADEGRFGLSPGG